MVLVPLTESREGITPGIRRGWKPSPAWLCSAQSWTARGGMRTGPRSFLTLVWLPPGLAVGHPRVSPGGLTTPLGAPCRCEWCAASWGPPARRGPDAAATARMVGFPVLDQHVWRASVPGFLAQGYNECLSLLCGHCRLLPQALSAPGSAPHSDYPRLCSCSWKYARQGADK
jgi:hypothetical protein